MRWIPFVMRIYRAWLYYQKERDFAGFRITNGLKMRDKWTEETVKYIRKMAPDRYIDFLIPKTEIGCKRRVNDTGYLACLHRDNVELVYDDPIKNIESKGIRTKSGKFVAADAIVLAHGFETQTPLFPMKIYGKNGITINEHVSLFHIYANKILTFPVESRQ
jgi:cation diffusion facilitator CzcD-associated flavoprotein CzcO